MTRASLAVLFCLVAAAAAAAKPVPCTCRYDGRDMPEGALVCIDLASGTYLARCERVLNNTAWRRVTEGCPTG